MTAARISIAALRRLWESDLTVKQIADQLGYKGHGALSKYAHRRGLPHRHKAKMRRAIGPDREAEFADMWGQGVSLRAMAAHFETTVTTIYNTAERLGLDMSPRGAGISIGYYRQTVIARGMAASAAQAQQRMADMARRLVA